MLWDESMSSSFLSLDLVVHFVVSPLQTPFNFLAPVFFCFVYSLGKIEHQLNPACPTYLLYLIAVHGWRQMEITLPTGLI